MSIVPAIFPTLSTGAVAQYPLPLTYQSTAEIIGFLDGTDQRYIRQSKNLRVWQVQLSVLNESEIASLEAFFETQDGQYLSFDFPDPYSGSIVANCRFGAPDFVSTYTGVDLASASLFVVETNG